MTRHIPLSRVCPLITELSRQRYNSLQRNTARTTTVHYDWSLLNNRVFRDKYTLTLRNKFDALSNDKYENFVNADLKTSVECIPTKQKA